MNTTPSEPSIHVEDLTVRYSNGHVALRDVNLALHGGTICALVGVNGSGKSTLFKSITGQVRPMQGSLRLSGLPVKKALKQSKIAYVQQIEDVDWQFPVSVHDVVMMGRYGFMNILRIPKAKDKAVVHEAMRRVSVDHLAGRQIGELSGGQKKRVFLARALAQQCQIILLDEPFTGVDLKTEEAIMDLLRELRSEGHLILIATHNLGSVPEFCDQVALINRTVLAFGPTREVFTQKNLEMTFGGVLRNVNLNNSIQPNSDGSFVTVLTDDERAAVFYNQDQNQ